MCFLMRGRDVCGEGVGGERRRGVFKGKGVEREWRMKRKKG
jgi:hypothetical protein